VSRSLGFAISFSAFQRWRLTTAIIFLWVFACALAAVGQAGFKDDRVMLQGFYWESYQHGYPEKFPNYGDKHWYAIIQSPCDRHAATIVQSIAPPFGVPILPPFW